MAGYVLNEIIDLGLLTTLPATPTAPTQAELGAGVDLKGSEQAEQLVAINGWRKSVESITTGGYASLNRGALAGPRSYPQSSLVWSSDDTSEVIFDAVAETNTLQWVFIAQQGFSSGNRAQGFPVTIADRQEGLDEGVAQTFESFFSLTPPYVVTAQAA